MKLLFLKGSSNSSLETESFDTNRVKREFTSLERENQDPFERAGWFKSSQEKIFPLTDYPRFEKNLFRKLKVSSPTNHILYTIIYRDSLLPSGEKSEKEGKKKSTLIKSYEARTKII